MKTDFPFSKQILALLTSGAPFDAYPQSSARTDAERQVNGVGVATGVTIDHIKGMGTFSTSTVRLHVAALDLAEKAFLTLPEDNRTRSQSLSNLHIARQVLAMYPPGVRQAHQIFREVRSAFPDYETTNLPLARAINAARDAAQPR